MKLKSIVIPAKAGIQGLKARYSAALDTGFRRYDVIESAAGIL